MTLKELYLKINVFSKTDYLKNIVGQAGIVFIAQLIPIAFSPLISRVYDENALAEITGLVSLSSLFLAFTSFKLGSAIVIEKDEYKSRQLMVLIFMINIFTVLIATVILFTFKDFFVNSFKIDKIIYFVPIFILSFSLCGTFDAWFVRQKKFKYKAYGKIIESVAYLIFAFSVYFVIDENTFGLALGRIIGVVLAVLFLIKLSNFKFPRYTWGDLKSLLVKYKEFPLHNMPSNFINVISIQILVIFLGLFYAKSEVGFFGLANMVILAPISFVSQAVSSIYFQKITEDVNKNNYKLAYHTFLKTFFLLTLIAVPGFLVLWFFSETLIPLIFGENWILTGKIAKLLSLVFLIQIIVGPISGATLIPLGKIKLNAIWQYARFSFMAIGLLLMAYVYKLDFLAFIEAYSYFTVISYSVYFFIIYSVIKKKARD